MEPVTVAICTRNRGAALATAVRSVLASRHDDFRLLVIDQSSDTESRRALEPFHDDPRLRYIAYDAVGVSRARNLALREADTNILAYTDDDCEVAEDWLTVMQSIFDDSANIVQAFCSVLAGPHDPLREFIPTYVCNGTRVASTLLEKRTARGMGAGMAVRRKPILAMGGFDEELGPGARFPSCEEGDVAVRAILNGYSVCETDRTFVTHHGARTWSEGKQLSRRDWVGVGAAYSKPLRVGAWGIVPTILYELAVKAVGPAVIDLGRGRRPRGLARGAYFLGGFVQGLTAPFDSERVLFKGN